MGNYFVGRRVELLSDNGEKDINIWHMRLERQEVGHMACRSTDAMVFLCVTEGQLECQVDQNVEHISRGETLFINKKHVYRFTKSLEQNLGLYLVEVTEEYLGGGFPECLREKYISDVAGNPAFGLYKFVPSRDGDGDEDILIQAVQAAAETVEVRDTAHELDLKSWILTAWGSLYRKFVQLSPSCKKAVLREREKLTGMVEYLNGHYKEKLTLSCLAEKSGVSSGEYCRFFKKHMGITPFEYLQKCRIEHSMDLLLQKTGNMAEVALNNGFHGSSYYSETFKKEMGCAPGDYRKWYRGDVEKCPLKYPEDSSSSGKKNGRQEQESPAHLL